MDPADYYDDETRSGEPMEGAEGAGPEVDLASVMEVDGGPKSCVCPPRPDQEGPPRQGRGDSLMCGWRRMSSIFLKLNLWSGGGQGVGPPRVLILWIH